MKLPATGAWPAAAPTSPVPAGPDGPLLTFHVSLNEEHVTIRIDHGGKSVYLGERSHHCSLLALARLRLSDAGRGLDGSSQGWADTAQLAHSLGIDQGHLNIHVHRARKLFKLALPGADALPAIVERRRCELRFGTYCFQIVRGAVVEGRFPSAAVCPAHPN